jgi:signal transduction histidine kinase
MSSDAARGRAWLATIVETSEDAIVGYAPDGAIMSWNSAAARLYGHTCEEALGSTISMLLASGPVQTRHAQVHDPDGNVLGTVTVAHAVSEPALELKRRLEGAAQLAGGLAQDFNHLLGIIIRRSACVDDELPRGSEAKEDIDEIQWAVGRAAELARRLQRFSDGAGESDEPESIDLYPFTRGLQQRLRCAAGEGVGVEILGGAGLWPVQVDRARLAQALVNLAENAGDAMPDGGLLVLALGNTVLHGRSARLPAGRYVRLTAADSGTGMSPEVLERVFEPFFTTRAPGNGAGLGLATVYGTVTRAGGDIAVESVPGIGTSVTIRLPARMWTGPRDPDVARAS